MFWTRFVRGWNKIFLALVIIASIVVGILFANQTMLLSLLLIPIVALLGFATVAVIMMISEISVSLHEINIKLSQTGTIPVTANAGAVTPKPAEASSEKRKNSIASWTCVCGARNLHTANFCAQCGSPKSKQVTPV